MRRLRAVSALFSVSAILAAACSSDPGLGESTSSSAEAILAAGGGVALPILNHPITPVVPIVPVTPVTPITFAPIKFPIIPAPPVYPTYDKIFQKAIHNAYWLNVYKTPDDIGAAGAQMRIWDMMMHEHARSMEWDLHEYRDPYTKLHSHPGEYRVYHTDEPANSQCSTLADCLQLLNRLDYVLPQHEVMHIALELKELDDVPLDDSLFDTTGFNPEDLDRVIWEHLGSKIYTPAEFLSRCPGMTMRQCSETKGWPTTDQLRGRYIFTVHGTEQTPYIGAANERAFWQYGSVDIHTRAAFPMYVVKDGITDAARPSERASHYGVTDAADFATMWRNLLDNTVIFDLEAPGNADFVPVAGGAPTLDKQYQAIVRPAAAHLVTTPVPPGQLEDDVGSLVQLPDVQKGWQLVMTDYPANYLSDVQFDDQNPLKLPTRVSRPFSVLADTLPRQAANQGAPTWGEPGLVEPGNRIYFDTANRNTFYDVFYANDESFQTDAKHLGYAQALLPAPAAATQGVQDWEVFPSTSMQGHSSGPLETTPYGQGCFVAAASPSGAPDDPTVAAAGPDYIKVCRNPRNDDPRSVDVSVTTMLGGKMSSSTQTLSQSVLQGASIGDALRVRLTRNGSSTTAQVYTSAEMSPDGSPVWLAWSSTPTTFGSDLMYQGLAQRNDGVFTGTRLNGAFVPLSAFTATNGSYVYDLSFCNDGSCRSTALPSNETLYTSTVTGSQFVGVHETEGSVYGGQWRTQYTTDQYEVTSSGLGQYPWMDKFLLLRTPTTDTNWTPLYKCIDWTQDRHVYWLDTDPSCPNDKGPAGRNAGAMGSVAKTGLTGMQPLYHLRKGTENVTDVNTHDHYFAVGFDASTAKQNNEGYELVKVVGYVFTPSTLDTPPCIPATKCANGWNCETSDDGCGGTISCGTCSGTDYCYNQKCIAPGTDCTADCQTNINCASLVGNSVEYSSCRANLAACIAGCAH